MRTDATGVARVVVLEQLARGLFFRVALALELPEDYRLPPTAEVPADIERRTLSV